MAIEEAAGGTNTAPWLWKGSAGPAAAPWISKSGRPALGAALKAERASLAAQGRGIETEAAPVRYVAELVGTDTDNERAIRANEVIA